MHAGVLATHERCDGLDVLTNNMYDLITIFSMGMQY